MTTSTIAGAQPGNRRFTWLAGFVLAALFIGLRWNSYDAPLSRDEGEYAYSAQILMQGAAPYEHAFLQKPPMVIYTYALSQLLAPHVFWAPRIVADVFVALATLFLGYIARLEFGGRTSFMTMLLATPLLMLPELEQFGANTETFMLLPLIATAAFYVHARKYGHKPTFLFAAGFLGAVTFLYKYTALPILLFIYLAWLVDLWRLRNRPILWRGCTSLVLGVAAASVIVLGYFLAHDGGRTLWECTIAFNRYYAASSNFSFGALWSSLADFWSGWWVLFILLPAVFLNQRAWFWLGLFAAAWLSTGASRYSHYYILVMPFWALLCAVGINHLACRINQRFQLSSQWTALLLAVIAAFLVLRPDIAWLTCSPDRLVRSKYTGYPFIEAQLVAQKIDALSSPDDFVYVAGSEPEILCYAHRFSPTRFMTTYGLMIPTPVVQKYQSEAMNDLLAHPPALIVYVNSSSSWMRQPATPPQFFAFLDQFMSEKYERVGGYLVDGEVRRWVEPLTPEESANATLILWRRQSSSPAH